MLSNLIVTAQRLWAGATSVLTADRSRGSNCGLESSAGGRIHDGQWANETKAEVLFAAILMLHAGRIHAHRQAWFNDLSLDLSSCSFQQESLSPDDVHTPHLASTSTRQRAPGMCEQDLQAMLPLSVARIVSSSDAIMRQIRADQRRSTSTQFASAAQNLPSTAMMPVHWPFFGCCNMVAAFGYVVAVAAGGSGETHLQFDAEHGEMCVDDFSPMAECTAPGDATRAGGDGLAALHSSTQTFGKRAGAHKQLRGAALIARTAPTSRRRCGRRDWRSATLASQRRRWSNTARCGRSANRFAKRSQTVVLPSTSAGRRDWAPPEQAAVLFVRPLCSLFQPEGRSGGAATLHRRNCQHKNGTARQLSSERATWRRASQPRLSFSWQTSKDKLAAARK